VDDDAIVFWKFQADRSHVKRVSPRGDAMICTIPAGGILVRQWMRLTLPIGLAAVFYFSVLARQPAGLRPVSVQMHVHASMSEGPGSWRAANVHAKKVGLDVLWWSDHDWRMAYHTYNRAFGFEGPAGAHDACADVLRAWHRSERHKAERGDDDHTGAAPTQW
jgi:hypothetical protein